MKALTFVVLLMLFVAGAKSQTADSYAAKILGGVSGSTANKTKPYVAAGDRAYLIGTQDGKFPDLGDHVKGEMAGLWCPPFKLADGFWVSLKDNKSGKQAWLSDADNFTNYPYGDKLTYQSPLSNIKIERFQFCPDGKTGVLVKYTLKNTTSFKRAVTFSFNLKTDIRPVWFTDAIDIDYADKVLSISKDGYFLAKDGVKPWYLAVVPSVKAGSQQNNSNLAFPEETIGKGLKHTSNYNLVIPANSSMSITFAIAGATGSQQLAISEARTMLLSYDNLLRKKTARYRAIINQAKITIPDSHLQTVYNWVKINTDWLKRTVPGIGTGLTAGYMEYPWWFGCDNTYSLQAVLATGDFKLAKSTLELLFNQSQKVNGDGRVVHEISTSGKVYNKGNTQETAHFIMCAGTYLKWTGDIGFIKKVYPSIKGGINWLLTTMDTNHNLFPEGYGIMEVTGLNAELIDVAVYTQQALRSAAVMATELKDDKAAKQYAATADELERKINKYFWDDANHSYCDFYGTKQQALKTLDGALKQLKINDQAGPEALRRERELFYEGLKKQIDAMPDTSRGWLTNKNWVINTPMETGIAPYKTAIAALDKIRMDNCGEYGPYLSAVEKKYMMTIATGVQAVAECRYGRIDSALWYVNRIAATFNRTVPGSISEMMPDYGCFTQAWTNYGIDVPLVSYIFGFKPDAYHHKIDIVPILPKDWKNALIENVKASDNNLSLGIKKSGNKITYTINQSKADWHLTFKPDTKSDYCILNGKTVKIINGVVQLTGNSNTISADI